MIFIFILCTTLTGAGVHLVRTPAAERTRKRVVEVLLLYFLCVQWGFGAILTAVPHIIVPDTIAGYIGWTPGSPFQVEMGFASLGLGVLGVLCIWLRGTFWLAPAIGRSILLYGVPTYISATSQLTATCRRAMSAFPSYSTSSSRRSYSGSWSRMYVWAASSARPDEEGHVKGYSDARRAGIVSGR